MSIVGRSQSTTAGFDPASVGGLLLWLDAADAATITFTGSNVSRWVDKSGNGYTMDTAPSGCSLPVRGTAINGLSTVGINTLSCGIKQSNVINGITNFFWVRREVEGNQFYFGADGTYDFHTGNSQEYASIAYSPVGLQDASMTIYLSNSVVRGRMAYTQLVGVGNINLLCVSNITGNTRMQGLSYDRGNTFRSQRCDWGEILLYSNALTQSQITAVEGYLARRWGIPTYLSVGHPYRSLGPVFRPFSPLDVPGLVLWLDAADSNAFTLSGSNVTTWNDKSGNGYNTSNLTGTATLSNNSVVFTGTQALGTNLSWSNSLNTHTMFAVVTYTTLQGAFVETNATTGTSGSGLDQFVSSGGQQSTNGWASAFQVRGATGITTGVTHLHEYTHAAGGSAFLYLNGTQTGSNLSAPSFAAGGLVSLGNWKNGGSYGDFFRGRIHEVLFYTSVLTATPRQQVEAYIARKWGLSSSVLTSNHPFYRYKTLSVPFTPLQIPGCTLWLDGQDATTLTFSGSNIIQWSDKSGLNNHATQATPSNGPTYVVDSGYPSVRFTRANSQILAGPGVFTSIRYGAFLVYRGLGADGQTPFFDMKKTGGAEGSVYVSTYLIADLRTSRMAYAENPPTFKDAAYVSFTTDRTLWGHVDSPENPSSNFYHNGSLLGQTFNNGGASNIATDQNGYTLSRGGSHFDGFICEFLVFTTEPTTVQRQQIEGYLAARWGLQSFLPSTHPYKSSKP